jgi:hypothetical protein
MFRQPTQKIEIAPAPEAPRKPPRRVKALWRGKQVVWFIFGSIEVLLGFRFFLKLSAANPAAGFTKFIYGASSPFVGPFLAVFKITRVEESVFEWTTLLAMVVYWVIAVGVSRLIVIGKPVSREEADEKIDRNDI